MKLYDYIMNKVSRCITLAPFMCLLMVLVCSCRPSRNLTTETNKDYSGSFELLMQRIDSVTKSMTMNQQEIFKRISNLKVENTTVLYSLPDSTGKQYPMQESTTKVNKENRESRQIDTQIIDEVQKISVGLEKLMGIVESAIDNKTEKVMLSWWSLNKDKVYFGVILLLFAAFFYSFNIRK